MIKAVIVDDEQPAVDEIIEALAELSAEIEVVAVARSVASAITVLNSVVYDLVFMDIHLGDGDSFEIFDKAVVNAPVIFITAYDTYALKAFANKGIDYLLKPFSPSDMQRALDKINLLSTDNRHLPAVKRNRYKERYLLNVDHRIISLPSNSIAYFVASGKHVSLRTFDNETYPVSQTLAQLTESLDPSIFFRINRKFIINFVAIKYMIRYSSNRIRITLSPAPEKDSDTIVSGDRIALFREWLNR